MLPFRQVLFHVATAMPSLARDPTCNEKRKYIGNDYVSIVYNDSGADFNILTIKVLWHTILSCRARNTWPLALSCSVHYNQKR